MNWKVKLNMWLTEKIVSFNCGMYKYPMKLGSNHAAHLGGEWARLEPSKEYTVKVKNGGFEPIDLKIFYGKCVAVTVLMEEDDG